MATCMVRMHDSTRPATSDSEPLVTTTARMCRNNYSLPFILKAECLPVLPGRWPDVVTDYTDHRGQPVTCGDSAFIITVAFEATTHPDRNKFFQTRYAFWLQLARYRSPHRARRIGRPCTDPPPNSAIRQSRRLYNTAKGGQSDRLPRQPESQCTGCGNSCIACSLRRRRNGQVSDDQAGQSLLLSAECTTCAHLHEDTAIGGMR